MMNILIGKKIIAKDAKLLVHSFSHFMGLRFSKFKNLIFDFGLSRKEIIDMFFVFYPIDVIFLDSNKKVVEIKENFKPFRIYNMREKARYMIELKCGTISKNKIKVSDNISF